MNSGWIELFFPLSITIALLVIGVLSRRFGRATRAAPYYGGFFVAALMVALSVGVRVANLLFGLVDVHVLGQDMLWIVLYHGLPALGVTIGVVVAWRYWSWLLAERD